MATRIGGRDDEPVAVGEVPQFPAGDLGAKEEKGVIKRWFERFYSQADGFVTKRDQMFRLCLSKGGADADGVEVI